MAPGLKPRAGMKGTLDLAGLQIWVRITDTRQIFGREEVEVEPVAGTGRKWVSRSRVSAGRLET